MSDLLPCPHCGSDRITVFNIRDGQQAVCKDCKSMGSPTYHGPDGFGATRGNAVKAWNRRATPPASDLREENSWQPMDTAPKDGTRILVRAVCFQWNSDICQNVAIGHRAMEASFRAGMVGTEPAWCEWCGDEKVFSTDWIVAEGWAPLPAPPLQTEGK